MSSFKNLWKKSETKLDFGQLKVVDFEFLVENYLNEVKMSV